MNLDSIKLKMSSSGIVTISVDGEKYKLVMIGFGKGTVVYQYIKQGELHAIIVGPEHYNKYGKLEVEKDV
jgi:hypothetical protein